MTFALRSSAFADGATIPVRFTCDGENVSPPIDWSGMPEATGSLVLIVDDPDAPSGTFTHWVLYDIPATTKQLPEGERPGGTGRSGVNGFGKKGYGGPCPPRGNAPHRYNFTLSALDVSTLGLGEGADRRAVESRMRDHLLGTARWMGRYGRK
jgi:Raf kinase inhibitor-like YbhB/YbcL family protein